MIITHTHTQFWGVRQMMLSRSSNIFSLLPLAARERHQWEDERRRRRMMLASRSTVFQAGKSRHVCVCCFLRTYASCREKQHLLLQRCERQDEAGRERERDELTTSTLQQDHSLLTLLLFGIAFYLDQRLSSATCCSIQHRYDRMLSSERWGTILANS